jgi:hypothetical protein
MSPAAYSAIKDAQRAGKGLARTVAAVPADPSRGKTEEVNTMIRRLLASCAAMLIMAVSLSAPASAGPRTETGFYEGSIVRFIQPAVFSSDSNQATLGCFGLGPDLAATNRSAPAPILYVILNDDATQDHCDGDPTAARHDHVLSTAPGHPGYTGSWSIVFAVPGPQFDPADMPYTRVAQVLDGVAAGQLVLVDPGVRFIAPVIGGAG